MMKRTVSVLYNLSSKTCLSLISPAGFKAHSITNSVRKPASPFIPTTKWALPSIYILQRRWHLPIPIEPDFQPVIEAIKLFYHGKAASRRYPCVFKVCTFLFAS
jgi:hypothetical protein